MDRETHSRKGVLTMNKLFFMLNLLLLGVGCILYGATLKNKIAIDRTEATINRQRESANKLLDSIEDYNAIKAGRDHRDLAERFKRPHYHKIGDIVGYTWPHRELRVAGFDKYGLPIVQIMKERMPKVEE